MLHRLAESDEAALVVERAPAPHISAGDPALEWRLGPAGLRTGLDRNHVLMSQQHDRWDTRIGSRPLVQQAVAVHFLELERGMELWERGSQVALEAIELTSVELARILKGDGLEAQCASQALRERRRVERLDRHRRRLGLARGEREGALEHHDHDDYNHDEQGAETPFHNARKCRDRAPSARACSRPSCELRRWRGRGAGRDSLWRTPAPSCMAASPGAPGRRPPPRRSARDSRPRDSDSGLFTPPATQPTTWPCSSRSAAGSSRATCISPPGSATSAPTKTCTR